MRQNSPKTTNTTLNYSTILVSRLFKLSCRRCRTTLDLTQPNIARPDQLLAICPKCDAWYRIVSRVGETHALMISLPDCPAVGPGADPVPNPTA